MSTLSRSLASALGMASVLLAAAPATAEAPPQKDWAVRLSPYLWFTSIQGNIAAGGVDIDIDAGFADIFPRLNLAAMGEAELVWRRFFVAVDTFWANLGDKENLAVFRVDWELDQLIVDTKFGYRLLSRRVGPGSTLPGSERGRLDLDLVAGLRYWRVDTEIEVTPVLGPRFKVDVGQDWVEPLVGARLSWQAFERWSFGLRGDAGGFGAGEANVTWRASGLLGFALGRHWDLVAGYRAIGIDQDDGSGVTRAKLRYVMHGPLLGVSLHF